MQIKIQCINSLFICPSAHHKALWVLFVFMCSCAYQERQIYYMIFGVLEILQQ